MYAVVEIGGHQYKVSEGDVLFVDKQKTQDQEITLDRVLLVNDEGNVTVGTPVVEGAAVEAKLLDEVKADKVIVFKKKRRKGYRVKRGHRQQMSQIKIEEISISAAKKSGSSDKKKSASPKKEAAAPEQVSTDMTAKEAIAYIKDTPLDQLEGFVPEDEERVTVLDAWESKKED